MVTGSGVRRVRVFRVVLVIVVVAPFLGCVPFVYSERSKDFPERLSFRNGETGRAVETVLVVPIRSRSYTGLAGPDGPVGASEAAYIDEPFVYRSGSVLPSIAGTRSAGIALGPAAFSYRERLLVIAPGYATSRLAYSADAKQWLCDLQPLPPAPAAQTLRAWRDVLTQSAVPREQLEGLLGEPIVTTEEAMQQRKLWNKVKIDLSEAERRTVNAFVEEGLRQLQTTEE